MGLCQLWTSVSALLSRARVNGVREPCLSVGVRGACKNDYLEIEGTGEKAFDAMSLREIEAMCRCWGKFDDGHTCPYELHG